jgi:hypothetical protein
VVKLGGAGQVDVALTRIVHRHKHAKATPVGLVRETGKAGANAFAIKQVHHHMLAPGTYKLSVYTSSGTATSKAKTLNLRVMR